MNSPLEALRDAHARTVRILEACEVGEYEFAELALDDLAADLWTAIEAMGRAA